MAGEEGQPPKLQQERRDHCTGAAGHVVVWRSAGAERLVPQILRQAHLWTRAQVDEV